MAYCVSALPVSLGAGFGYASFFRHNGANKILIASVRLLIRLDSVSKRSAGFFDKKRPRGSRGQL